MDLRKSKVISNDVDTDYSQPTLMAGYDHCNVVSGSPCAVLSDLISGRTMQEIADCPGVQVYTANKLGITGKPVSSIRIAALFVSKPSTTPMQYIIPTGRSRL